MRLSFRYYSTQSLSTKSDVFSFGVVLLEIVTGREPLDVQRPRDEWSLVEWVSSHCGPSDQPPITYLSKQISLLKEKKKVKSHLFGHLHKMISSHYNSNMSYPGLQM